MEKNTPKATRGPRGGKGPMGPGRITEKPKDFKKGLGSLLLFCKSYLPIVIFALICAVGGAIFTIIGPDKVSELTNIISAGLPNPVTHSALPIDFDSLNTIVYTLIFYYSASAVLSFIQGFIMTDVNQRVSRKLRGSISLKINRLPISFFNTTSFGDVLSRVTNDVDTISETLQRSVSTLATSLTLLFGCLIMMFKTNWIMAITAIAASFIGFIIMSLIMGKSQKYFSARQKWLGELNGHIEEAYSGHIIIKAYNAEEKSKKDFEKLNHGLFDSNWKSQFISGLMMPLMGFIGNLGFVSVCVVGALLASEGTIDFGVIVAFMIYVRLFTNPLSQIAQAFTSLQSTAAASERVFEFLEEKEMSDESDKQKLLENPRGEVEFKNVRFGYDPDKIIIKNFSEHIAPGQKIAIVGPTGAGKTTMVNLLMRFFELNSGEILIDGIPISQLTRSNVHALFGMVLQDTWLFEGTIKENIIYGKENVGDEEVKSACKAVGLYHFIKTLPEGYNTVLGDNVSLSAGQKQLLTIARAMVENAPMLILDEATSSVDTRTEVLIQKAMETLTEGRTSFVIAHRLSTIKNSDMIFVMKDGNVVESGTHGDLLEKNGFYAELYNSQFEEN